ncbi:MAG: hypothetical protein E7270_08620 [Lachnospiraceae bacterium]|nr:hypothetical protein [Lachnospiraceae bacterium]
MFEKTSMDAGKEIYSSYVKDSKPMDKTWEYGKTIGTPKLSEEASKYYEELNKKYGDMEFVLVSSDMKDYAQSQAAKFANPTKTVVLIDEEKLEKMATDENFRKKYEGIISNARNQLSQIQQSVGTIGTKVKGYGIQVNDNGLTSYFAVLDRGYELQRERIEEKAEERKEEKKLKAKEELEERYHKSDTVTITANSIEELIQKISDYGMEERTDNVQTKEEKMLGQHIDFNC